MGNVQNCLSLLPSLRNKTGVLGLFGAGSAGGAFNGIESISINTLSNGQDYGDLDNATYGLAATSNGASGRALFGGGWTGSDTLNTIEYVPIQGGGSSASDFGNLSSDRSGLTALSNGVNDRGIFTGGGDPGTQYQCVIDVVNISSIGSATYFGNLTQARKSIAQGVSNATGNRGVIAGGNLGTYQNTIDYINITSESNASDFGDLLVIMGQPGSVNNGTNNRGLFAGGYNGSTTNSISYITVTSLSNAQDYGDLGADNGGIRGTSNGVDNRGIFGGGNATNIVQYVNINSLSNTSDFGDLAVARSEGAATSNA